MNPALMTSASPATRSARGRVASTSRSQTTPAGSWKAPTRFLPSAVLMPALPPTAASTIASRVVGTCTTATPRSQVAATKPARSVTVPPPTATTASERVKASSPMTLQSRAATVTSLADSLSGTPARWTRSPAAESASATTTA